MTSLAPPAPAVDPREARVGSLDGLRAVATLLVFLYHLTWRTPVVREHLAPVLGHGDTGVEVFFVLSGFLIFGPFAAAVVQRRALPALPAYVARRVARIWPAYLVALGTITVLGIAHFHGLGFLKHATLTYQYYDDKGGEGLSVAWTLVVEASFYAAVPLLAWAIARTGRRLLAWSVALVAVGVWAQHLAAYSQDTYLWVRILPPAFLTLGLGMLLASVRALGDEGGAAGRGLRALAARPAIPLLVAAGAFVTLVASVHAGPDLWHRPDERYLKELLQAVIAGALVLPVVLAPEVPGRWVQALSRPVVSYLGTISYGFYLWHAPVLGWVRPLLRNDQLPVAMFGAGLALLATLALAAASWELIERPIIDVVARRLRQRRSASVR